MAPPLDSQYSKMVAKSVNYTIDPSDDQVNYTVAVPRTVTLPKAATCPLQGTQFRKRVVSLAASVDTLTIAVQTGDTLVGDATVGAGETMLVESNGIATWTTTGGTGATGASGYSGFSGASGRSGYSGYSGISGPSGYSGWSGYSGDSGYSGYSGVSGISGYSGFSGYSGYSGI